MGYPTSAQPVGGAGRVVIMNPRTRVLAIITFVLSVLVAGATQAPAATGPQTVELAAPAGSGLPVYVAVIRPVSAERLGNSWHEGCPVGPDQLRLV
ncbi:M15 family peptidase, partial [Amycolatopsis sp. NPDC004169]